MVEHFPIMPRTTEKITITILLHIPKYSATVSAWTSTWVNQRGYVTCSYNVTHDGKITITIVLHIPKYSATVCAWTSTWVNQKGYVTCSYNFMHDGKNHYHDFVTYPEVLSNCMCMDFNPGEPGMICNRLL